MIAKNWSNSVYIIPAPLWGYKACSCILKNDLHDSNMYEYVWKIVLFYGLQTKNKNLSTFN